MSDTQNNENALQVSQQHSQNNTSVFSNTSSFEGATRMASALAKSEIVPKIYQGSPANTIVALEMANRMGVSPLMVMQNLDIIHGRPAFNAKFTVAMINGTGKYTPMRYRYTGEGDKRSCVAYCKELSTGETLDGPPVSVEMAKKEGWYGKQGSKWPTMTDLMLMYRAGAFWSRMYEPGITMGILTTEEVHDISETTASPAAPVAPASGDEIAEKLSKRSKTKTQPEEAVIVSETPTSEQSPEANNQEGDDWI